MKTRESKEREFENKSKRNRVSCFNIYIIKSAFLLSTVEVGRWQKLARLIPRNSSNRRNLRKIIITFLHTLNSLRIITQLTLIPFHGFSESKITPILFSANSAFLVMALYVKTKTRNSRKVSKTFIYFTSDEQCLQCTV